MARSTGATSVKFAGADKSGLALNAIAAVGSKVDASEFLVDTAAQTADQHLI